MLGNEEEINGIESDGLLGQPGIFSRKRHRHARLLHIFFVSALVLNIFLAGFGLAYWLFNERTVGTSYETGFASDLNSIKSEIELREYVFAGGVELDEHGDYFTDHKNQQYVGSPSPEVDHAWHRLLSGLNIDLDSSETELSHRTFQWPGSGEYFTGLEVFHSLHCLNRLRQALYPDYYQVFNNPDDPSREDHIGHCVNHLRQAIQCHSDLTPMEWKLAGNKVILNTSTRHTCRNFEKVHEWAKQRRANLDEREAVKNGSLFIVD